VRERAFQEELPATSDRRRAAEADLEYMLDDWSLRAGFRFAQDRRGDGSEQESVLAHFGLARELLDDRLTLYAERDQNLSGLAGNLDYPERTRLGAAFKVSPQSTLIAEQEWSSGEGRETTDTRLGLESEPWSGGRLTGGISRYQAFEPTTRLGASLEQRLRVSPSLELLGGFQRAQVNGDGDVTRPPPTPFHRSSGFALVPQGNNTAGFAGAQWRHRGVLYAGRAESSRTDVGQRTGFLASAQSEPHRDLGLISSIVASRETAHTGAEGSRVDARVGAAWRPEGGVTAILNRLDLVRTRLSSGAMTGPQWKLINNLHINHRMAALGQVSLHAGLKLAQTTVDGNDYDAFTSLAGLEWRRNLDPRWDVGLHAMALSSWRDRMHRTCWGASIGRSFGSDVWVSVGWNFAGFHDEDFSAARQSDAGAFVKFRMSFDQQSLAGLLRVIRED
jgi:hypothetical protein